jgi:threonine/homoserine/homoserine lactone efflux protein
VVSDPTPTFYLVGAILGVAYLMHLLGQLVERWIARQDEERKDAAQREEWIAAYQARHGKRG